MNLSVVYSSRHQLKKCNVNDSLMEYIYNNERSYLKYYVPYNVYIFCIFYVRTNVISALVFFIKQEVFFPSTLTLR